jgi:spermidine/putrescine transport system permease protein
MTGSTSERLRRGITIFFLVIFFLYMFAPLIYMMIAAFNSSRIPSVIPWRSFTTDWFPAMWNDRRMWQGLRSSALIGACVILLSVPIGLAGAFLITRFRVPGKSLIYGVLVAPVLMPGVIIGLSTLIFWDTRFNVGGRWELSVLGQTSFIAAYCMLIFMARLQRFDPTLEEAALDLGATPRQAFWTVTVPFLRPAILSAAALAFFQSFENYNTTLFTIGNDLTFTMYIAGRVRAGVTPAVNALACVMILLTILGGVVYELLRRREVRIAERRQRAAEQAETVLPSLHAAR